MRRSRNAGSRRRPVDHARGVSAAASRPAGPDGDRGRHGEGQPVRSERRRRQHGRVRDRDRRRRRGHQESRVGAADPRQDQDAHRQAGDDDYQHPHARRSRERQRGVSGHGRGHHAGEHEEIHGSAQPGVRSADRPGDERHQGQRRQRTADADVQGQAEHRRAAPTRSISATTVRPTPAATPS